MVASESTTKQSKVSRAGRKARSNETRIRSKVTCHYVYSMLELRVKSNLRFLELFRKTALATNLERAHRRAMGMTSVTLIRLEQAIYEEFKTYTFGLLDFYNHGPHSSFFIAFATTPKLAGRWIRKEFYRILKTEGEVKFGGDPTYFSKEYSVKVKNEGFRERLTEDEYVKVTAEVDSMDNTFIEIFKTQMEADNLHDFIIGLGEKIYVNRALFNETKYIILFALAISIFENNLLLSSKSLESIGLEAAMECEKMFGVDHKWWPIY